MHLSLNMMNPYTTLQLKVACVLAFYMVSALTMVFVNKAVLNGSPDIPLTFLLLQLVIAVAFLHITAYICPNKISIPSTNMQTVRKMASVVSVNIIGLVFNTLCLRGVDASFFQIARGLVLPLTIIVSSWWTGSTPSKSIIAAALIVTSGFMLGVVSTQTLPSSAIPSNISIVYGMLSSFFIAFHAVLIKSSLPHCNNSTVELAWWTNVGSAILIVPFIILFREPHKVLLLSQNADWDWFVFLWGTAVTGTFGFLLCIAGLLSIQITSPVTHMFSSAARSVLQTALGVWIFGDILTNNRAWSILIISGGTMWYTWIKSLDSSVHKSPSKGETNV